MPRPRISLIYTGGTIGMVRGADGALRPPADAGGLLKQLDPAGALEAIADISFHPLMNKDSSNIQPQDWTRIAGEARMHMLTTGAEGVVVLHGTDTLAHTAAALSYAFGPGLDRPIILTGAMTPVGEAGSDAPGNLTSAICAAATGAPVVAVAFANKVFRGTRVEKRHASDADAFASPDGPLDLGKVTRRQDWANFAWDFEGGVLDLKATPGFDPDLLIGLVGQTGVRGFILEGFGAGNLPDETGRGYAQLIRAAAEAGAPCVLVNPFGSATSAEYAPARAAIAAGAIPAPAITHTALSVKLMWLLGQAACSGVTGKARVEFVSERLGVDRAGEIGPA